MKNSINKAINALRRGDFVLIHDSENREDETDLVIAAQFIKPRDIARMRRDGGGLICIAVDEEIANKLELPFITEIYEYASEKFRILTHIRPNDIPYDEKSSFSITINYRDTFTGISDYDRALTIRRFAQFCKRMPKNMVERFGDEFRSPGHVPLLISSGIENREGHTELSTTLLRMANLTPVAAICEMLDSGTYRALSRRDAIRYANENNLVFLEGDEIKNFKKN